MTKEQKTRLITSLLRVLRKKLSIFMVACMLGVSNVILEEDRMVNDTRAKIEQQEVFSDED